MNQDLALFSGAADARRKPPCRMLTFGRAVAGCVAFSILLAVSGSEARGGDFRSWQRKMSVSFDGYTRAEPLTNFPALVIFSTNIPGFSYSQFLSATNDDLRFTDGSETNELNHEIETWDTNGFSYVWVQVPVLTNHARIWAFWGRESQSAPPCRTNGATWDSTFRGVWHLAEGSSGSNLDSTAYWNHGARSGNVASPGIAAGAQEFNGSSAYINCGNAASLQITTNLTLSIWIKPDTIAGERGLASKWGSSWCWVIGHDGTDLGRNALYFNGWKVGNTVCSVGAWNHLAVTYSDQLDLMQFYYNGAPDGSAAQTQNPGTSANLEIGRRQNGGGSYFDGVIDEVRVEAATRSSNWIWACWMNIASNGAFGACSAVGLGGVPSVSCLPATGVTANSAWLNGQITSTGMAESAAFVFWGTRDAGQNMSGWEHTNEFGVCGEGALCTNISGLAADTLYICRFAASNQYGMSWSETAEALYTGQPMLSASDPYASETGLDPGEFSIARPSSATGALLRINYSISGSATAGADFAPLSGTTAISAGATNVLALVSPLFDYEIEGPETVVMTLTNGPYVATFAAATVTVADAAHATWYVAPSGSDLNGGTGWGDALATPSNALYRASAGDTIIVSNGTYNVYATNGGSALVFDRNVRMIGFGGPAATILRRPEGVSYRIVEITAGAPDALIAGFTIREGRTALYKQGGAGVHMAAGTVSNCWIVSNSSVQPPTRNYRFHAAGVTMNGGLVVDCLIANNVARDYLGGRGGGVYMTAGTVRGCTVTNNLADGVDADNAGDPVARGGGMFLDGGGLVENCVIAANTATYGGGVYVTGEGTVRNCLIAHNRLGGGVYMNGGRVESCTIATNIPLWWQQVSGVSISGGGTLLNSIVWAHPQGYNHRIVLDYDPISVSAGTVSYCVLQKSVAGTGNLVADPQFLDPASWDFRLATNSPAIDAGQNQPWMASSSDVDGDPRVAGGSVDIGAHEENASSGPLRAYFSADARLGTNSLACNFTCQVGGSNTAGMIYSWNFGDGTVSGALASPHASHVYAPGLYSVALAVTNADGQSAAAFRTNFVRVMTDSDIYVHPSGGNTRPYTNWAGAARSPLDAVDMAAAGARIIVTNGVYGLSRTLFIERPIQITSVKGPEVTVLRASGASDTDPYRVVELLPSAGNALVAGFSISNGWSRVQRGGGAGVQIWSGTVSNCLIAFNKAQQYVSRNYRMAGCGATVFGGALVDCVVSNNTGIDYVGCRGAVYATNGLVYGCTVVGNDMYATPNDNDGQIASIGGGICLEGGGTAERCTISSNMAYYAGGAALLGGGTLRSCLVVNAADGGGVYMTGGAVENCTICGNSLGRAGWTWGGLRMSGGTTLNSIIYFNGGGNSVEKTGGIFDFCQTESAIAGASNSSIDPDFVNRSAGDYRLAAASPCIDTGTNQAWMASGKDMDGFSRLVGTAVDRGAYESDPARGPLACSFVGAPTVGSESMEVVFTASVCGSNMSGLVYTWDLGDGRHLSGSEFATVTNQYRPGRYSVSLSVRNGGGEEANCAKDGYIRVRTSNTVYVAMGAGSIAPYTNWTIAATSVHDAVDMADRLVLVNEGTYWISSEILLDRPITLKSVSGPLYSTIRRSGGVTRIINMTTNATVDGFTLFGGDTGGAGGGIRMTDGFVRNCVISSNRASLGGGGVYMLGGLVENCIVMRNWGAGNWAAGEGNDGCGGVQMYNAAKLRGCVITANEGVDRAGGIRIYGASCEVDNCTVVGNYGAYHHAGILATVPVTIRNIIAMDNKNGGGVQENFNMQGGSAAVYSCGPDVSTGNGNIITNDAGFLAPGSGSPGLGYVIGDYHLRKDSACVNRGTNLSWMAGAADLDGRPRITSGRVEMGAYELPLAGSVFVVR